MAREYKLNYTASEINEKLSKIGDLEIPAPATDEEMLDALIEADILKTVTDADGAILTDEKGNIILW